MPKLKAGGIKKIGARKKLGGKMKKVGGKKKYRKMKKVSQNKVAKKKFGAKKGLNKNGADKKGGLRKNGGPSKKGEMVKKKGTTGKKETKGGKKGSKQGKRKHKETKQGKQKELKQGKEKQKGGEGKNQKQDKNGGAMDKMEKIQGLNDLYQQVKIQDYDSDSSSTGPVDRKHRKGIMGVGAGAAMIGGIMIGKALADRRREREYQRYLRRQHKLPYEQTYYGEIDDEPLPTDYNKEPYNEAPYPHRQGPQHRRPVGPKQQKIPRDRRNKAQISTIDDESVFESDEERFIEISESDDEEDKKEFRQKIIHRPVTEKPRPKPDSTKFEKSLVNGKYGAVFIPPCFCANCKARRVVVNPTQQQKPL